MTDVPLPTHPVLSVLERLRTFGDYPAGMNPISDADRIPLTAFFPGGYGLWNPHGGLPDLPPRPVVVVGHNWGSVKDHRLAAASRAEFMDSWTESRRRGQPTWWNLLSILRGAGIEPSWCFFTNAYMGLRDEGNVGPLPNDPDYQRRCQDFLEFQLRMFRPALVIALGMPAKDMLAELSRELSVWRGSRRGNLGIKAIHQQGDGVVSCVVFRDGVECAAVVLNHTCDGRNLSKNLVREIDLLRMARNIARADA